MEKVVEFEAHTDFIRSVIVHPTLPYVLSASNDMLIKLWDWEKDLESHSFPAPEFTLDGFMSGSKPYLISGSDDHTAKV
ncbi:Coatomer subunit beta'-2 [Vitis vinifera]|uniref:Coatomer subunit beta'-2 n=1 Tax=Vitis vinifera TaxID=29760 RepID=A0A438DF09_VITVI|nr:Coatomer subunit beta'-2 [Vitis vinifera]